MAQETAEVAVVGAGPVGLIAAIELARAGLRPVLLDAKDGIAWSSRAICISRRSQEILDRIGAGAAFAAKGLGWSRGRTFYREREVFRLEMPFGPEDRHAPFINIQQFYTEQFLLDTLAALAPGCAPRWGHAVRGARQDDRGVSLDVVGPDGAYTLAADWVVAADGGRSVLREAFGLRLSGSAYESRYLIADIEVEGADRPVERNVWFDPPSNPGSTVILHVQPDNVWRIDYQLRDEEDSDEALQEKNVIARLQAQLDMMGVRAPWRMIWRSLYKALALSLDEYRHGRVLFAGDAAHLVPIFGVRGLNSGIDDAHNLGWKLALVARGAAPAALLDSYSLERRRATAENHAQATKSTWFMSPPGAGFRLMRDAALELAGAHDFASALLNPRQSAAHVYDASPAVTSDALPCAEGVVPGASLPNLPATIVRPEGEPTAGFLQDALPPLGFTLLAFVEALGGPRVLAPLVAALAGAGVPLRLLPVVRDAAVAGGAAGGAAAGGAGSVVDADGTLAARFAAAQFPLTLLRPDEHVAARFTTADSAPVLAALDRALGHPLGRAAATGTAAPAAVPATATERGFEAISRALEAAGPDGAAGLLARLTLLLAEDVGDADRVLRCVAAAAGNG